MPLAPEHIPTVDKVNTYLHTRAQGDLCRDVMNCNSWPAEAFLLDDLKRYVENTPPLPQASRQETRLYLRAVSWFLYPAVTEQQLLTEIDASTFFCPADRTLFHGALTHQLEEDALEPATQRIEALYLDAWDQLQKTRRVNDLPWRELEKEDLPAAVQAAKESVNALRPLRDTLYFRRHLSHWLAWSGHVRA